MTSLTKGLKMKVTSAKAPKSKINSECLDPIPCSRSDQGQSFVRVSKLILICSVWKLWNFCVFMNSDSLIKVDVKDMVLLIKQKQNFYLSLLVTQVEAKKILWKEDICKIKISCRGYFRLYSSSTWIGFSLCLFVKKWKYLFFSRT